MDNFTPRAKWLLERTKSLSKELGKNIAEVEHLLATFLFCEDAKTIRILQEMNFDYIELRKWLAEKFFHVDPKKSGKDVILSESINIVLESAQKFSNYCGDSWVSIDHIFIGILKNLEFIDGSVSHRLDFNFKHFEKLMVEYFKGETSITPQSTDPQNEGKSDSHFPFLEKHCKNLINSCYSDDYKLLGREDEIDKIQSILNRKNKNNVIIVGDPGVGKTSIIEYLAYKISNDQASHFLSNKTIYSLNLNNLISGTTYRGQFESKLESLIQEAKDANIILFIDEIHMMVGAGESQNGSNDFSNIIKPYLSNGELTIIGSTTFEEYRDKINKDKALNRRFDLVYINEPTKPDTLEILKLKKESFEKFHNVSISDEVLNSILDLSDRFIKNNCFPDKAIDLLDLTCSTSKTRKVKKPNSLLQKEKKLTDSLKSSQENDLDFKNLNDDQAQLFIDYKDSYLSWMSNIPKKKYSINIDDIRFTLSKKLGISKDKFQNEGFSKYINLNKKLCHDVFGQDEAVNKIIKCLFRYKSGLKEDYRPIGSFLFLGPTGVGKTYIAKKLASEFFASTNTFLKFDMSEFSEEHSISKLIGSSPGYVGFENGGLLIEKVSQNPHCLILFDEIEKAHPKVRQVLLQILDDGCLTDAIGRKADFTDSIIIVTGNIGSSALTTSKSIGFGSDIKEDQKKNDAFLSLKKELPPELINRFDEIVFFNSLSESDFRNIIKNELSKFNHANNGYGEASSKVSYSPSVINYILQESKLKEFGAREIKRTISNKILNLLAEYIVNNPYKDAYKVSFNKKSNEIFIST